MTSPWVLAARPKTLPAAAAPVLVGTALAAYRGAFAPFPALAALAGALLIQIATNFANDYFDFVKGADTETRVGPTRVTQAGLLSPAAVRNAMIAALAAALGVGVYLVGVGGWPIVWIGVASLVCAVAYTGGPYPLAYHGLGDLFVFIFFGLIAVAGTVYVQAGHFPPEAWLAGAGIGAMSTAILVVNNLRDLDTDARAGKRTMAVRLGPLGTRMEYAWLWSVAAIVPVAGISGYGWPVWTLLAWLGFGVAAPAMRRVWTHRAPVELLPALGQTAAGLLGYAVGLSIGLFIGLFFG
ncbi:MAG: 1,4-dihydroxy-2-naphthoate polyprenyltransferase [Longimicrobiales bacterium]|nr:1,4-dihydroxy-2-naphthoate polyprenyltransferase [Longimicrobiales bacterium]